MRKIRIFLLRIKLRRNISKYFDIVRKHNGDFIAATMESGGKVVRYKKAINESLAALTALGNEVTPLRLSEEG